MRAYKASIVAIILSSLSVSAESLYVFVPSQVRTNIVQEKIAESCPSIEVTAFGRAKDFLKKAKSNPPNGMISLSPVIDANESFNLALQGERLNQHTEPYLLVSIDSPISIEEIGNKKIGVVDLLGRKPMSAYIDSLLKVKTKIKRVTKIEDLLPLVTFGSVDGILISRSLFEEMKSKSNLNLVPNRLSLEVGLAALAINRNGTVSGLEDCVQKFEKSLNEILGVERWDTL